MSADIIKFVSNNVEPVHQMRRLQFYRFLQWFVPGACQVYVLVANTVHSISESRHFCCLPLNKGRTEQIGSNTIRYDLYSDDTRCKSRPGYYLGCLHGFSQSLQAYVGRVLLIRTRGHKFSKYLKVTSTFQALER